VSDPNVNEAVEPVQPAQAVAPFYSIGCVKLLALSLATLNFYQLIWFWQHWRHRRNALGERVLPAVRGILFPWIFSAFLGYRVAKAGVASQTAGWLPALAAGVLSGVALLGTAALPDDKWALLALLSVLPDLWLQNLANRVNRAVAPNHDANTRFTLANKIIVAIGSVLLLAAIFTSFAPDSIVEVEERF
jgi:hypothetical protein